MYKRLHTYLELYDIPHMSNQHPSYLGSLENIRGKIAALQVITDMMHETVENGASFDAIVLDKECLLSVRFTTECAPIFYNSYADTMTEALCAISLIKAQHEGEHYANITPKL